MPSQRVRDLAEAIVQVYVSYDFTDWGEAVNECVDSAAEGGETYTDAEQAEAEKLALTIARSVKQHYDTVVKEVLG